MGPLAGVTVVELAGTGSGAHGAMMLSDMGADVVRVDRVEHVGGDPARPSADLIGRGRRSIAVDLTVPEGAEVVLGLVERADAIVDVFRPGVTERLGIGPDACLGRNPRLVYGRMTGWGQHGPYACAPGHDINYIALAGALGAIGRQGEAPVPPLNLLGDLGGGVLLAFGVVCALFEARTSGRGQVIDAAAVDGVASLMTMIYGLRAMGIWDDERGTNLLDSGAPFYDVYETADGGYVSVAAIEPQRYAALLRLLDLDCEELPWQHDRAHWPELRARLAATFRTRTRARWSALMQDAEVGFAPVLSMAEAMAHPHNVTRGTFVDVAGVRQPAPAPRFSRTGAVIAGPPPHAGEHTDEVLAHLLGLDPARIAELRDVGAVA